MGKRQYTPARQEANARYNSKTYKQYTIVLRWDNDEDIINSIEAAKEKGLSYREWLREIFEGHK